MLALLGLGWTVLRSSDRSSAADVNEAATPVTNPVEALAHPSRRGAPSGRGAILDAGASSAAEPLQSASLEENQIRPHEEGMNGEVVAWVVDSSGQPVDQWLLLSEDCSVRARIHQGRALTLSPPGECRFRAAPEEHTEAQDGDWTRLEVIAADTVYLELIVADPGTPAADTG